MASAVKSRSLALLPSQQHVTLLTRPLLYLFLATLPSVQSQLERAFLSPEGQCSWASDLGLHFPLRAHFLESSPVPTILQLRGECLPLSSGPPRPLAAAWVGAYSCRYEVSHPFIINVALLFFPEFAASKALENTSPTPTPHWIHPSPCTGLPSFIGGLGQHHSTPC